MNFLEELLSNNGSTNVDDSIGIIKKKYQPNKDEGTVEAIVKLLSSIFFIQIAEGAVRGVGVIKQKLFNHYYPIGYIAGFSVSYIKSLKIEDGETQANIIKQVYGNIFADHALELFSKTFDPQNAQNKVFVKGTDLGWRDAQENISSDKEATGLKSFLLED